MTVLIVAAHPDDELLGCGATIARMSASDDVHIAILGEGATSRSPDRNSGDQRAVAQLKVQARAVATILGARSITFEDLPDNRFDELPLLDIVKLVEQRIQEVAPDVVYTHHPGDLNIDHGLTFRAVLTGSRPVAGCSVKELYAFEVPSSTEWAFQQLANPFQPNVFIDVAATMHRKLQALQEYDGETRAFPHPRSWEAIEIQARHWGSVVGLEYAEAFQLIRSVRS